MKIALRQLDQSMKNLGREVDVNNLGDIVQQHAITSALACAGSSILPGAGALIATSIATTSILAMYVRLAKEIGVTFKEGALKALASGVVADLSATIITNIVLVAALSFIPGVGQISASTLSMIANFALVYVAAYIFIKMLSKLLSAGKDISELCEEELKYCATSVKSETNVKEIFKEAKQQYNGNK